MPSSRAHKMAKGQYSTGGAVGRAMRTMRRHYADGGDVVKDRAMFLPLGTYGDGTTRAAWPGLLYEPAAAWKRMMDSGYRPRDAKNTRKMAEDSFAVAGAVPLAGLAAGAVRPGVSLGSGGGRLRAYHGGPGSNPYFDNGKGYIEKFRPGPEGAVFFTDDPKLAGDYAAARYPDRAATYPVDVDFKKPYEIDRAKEWTNQKEVIRAAREGGHDGIVARNTDDGVVGMPDRGPSNVYIALEPGTVYSATTGDQLYANTTKASAPGLGALEANRVRRIPDHAMREYRQAQDYLDKSPTGRIANQMQMLVDEYWKYNPDGAPPPSAAEHQAQVSRMFLPDTRPAPAPKAFEDTLEVRPVDSRQLHDIASANYDDYAIKSKVEMAPIETLQGQYHWDKKVGPLADEIANNGWFEPIIVNQDGVVIEGQHRLRAMQKLGAKRIPVQRIIGHD